MRSSISGARASTQSAGSARARLRAAASAMKRSRAGLDILGNAPEDARGIPEREVAHAPRLQRDVGHLDAIALREPGARDARVPGIDVLDEEMEHEVVGQFLVVEILEQEARLAVQEVGDA